MRDLLTFQLELESAAPRIEVLAIQIARLGRADLDVQGQLMRLDDLVAQINPSWLAQSGRSRAESFLDWVNHDLGFQGNQENYYDPANSFLNEVLDSRRGLPILLSVLCIALGKRLGLEIDGIGFPGHFMARYTDPHGMWFLDPFHGRVIDAERIPAYLSDLFGHRVHLSAQLSHSLQTPQIALRILNNLRQVYLQRQEFRSTCQVLDHMLLIAPNEADLWKERGLLRYDEAELEGASSDLQRYFYLTDQLTSVLGLDEDEAIYDDELPDDQPLWHLFHEISDLRAQLN